MSDLYIDQSGRVVTLSPEEQTKYPCTNCLYYKGDKLFDSRKPMREYVAFCDTDVMPVDNYLSPNRSHGFRCAMHDSIFVEVKGE